MINPFGPLAYALGAQSIFTAMRKRRELSDADRALANVLEAAAHRRRRLDSLLWSVTGVTDLNLGRPGLPAVRCSWCGSGHSVSNYKCQNCGGPEE